MLLFLRLFSYLPLSVLYFLADALSFITYYVVRYRRAVVRKNLSTAFPDKPAREIRDIERQFYRNLADTSVETLKLLTISEEDLLKRVKITDLITPTYAKEGRGVFGMAAHFCNWEWLLVSCTNQLAMPVHAVYQQLMSPFFNQVMINIRSRFGAFMHDKDQIIRDMVKLRGKLFVMSMVADQRPFSGENKFWSRFLNQEAAMYSGTEVLAKRMDVNVMYASMQRVKRGYYEITFKNLENNPRSTAPNEITEKFIQFVEEDVFKDPASYLWSHDRWKHKKPS